MTTRSTGGRRVTRRAVLHSGIATSATAAWCALVHAAEESPGGKISLQAFDKVEPQKFPWGWIRWVMNDQIDPQAEMTLGIVHIEPRQSNPPHVHPNSAEYLHVLTGSCEHRVGTRWVSLKAGDTLRIPKGVAHAARTQEDPCRVIVVYDTGRRQMVLVDQGSK